jgi:hypothetical protein
VRGVPLPRRHRRRDQPAGRGQLMSTETNAPQAPRYTKKDFESDQDVAGARAAGTTRSCRPSRR